MSDFNFEQTLNNLIKERKIKVKDLTNATGISRQLISDYRRGISTPKYPVLIKLADYFGVSCDYLLTGVEPADKQESQELGLSGDAIRLLKQCQDERVRGLVDRLLGSPEFYQRAKISFNELTKLDE